LTGFAIAGADRRFVWAKAEIQGEKVVVSHPQVAAAGGGAVWLGRTFRW